MFRLWRLGWLVAVGVGGVGCGGDAVPATGDLDSSSSGSAVAESSSTGDAATTTSGETSSSSSSSSESSSATTDANVGPIAEDDLVAVAFDAMLEHAGEQGLLSNDIDADGDPLVAEAPDHSWQGGLVSVAADGAFTYTPPPDFGGCDGFDYTALDGRGGEANATVHITVDHPHRRVSPVRLGMDPKQQSSRVLAAGLAAGWAGRAVAMAGDLNGDGMSDFAVGAPMWAPEDERNTGRVYIAFGGAKNDGSLESLLDSGGFALSGESTKSEAGYALSAAGDVNGDGFDDLVVGAWKTNLGGGPMGDVVGRTFVVWGGADLASRSLADITDGDGGFAITGAEMADFSGASVSGGGDYNGDGLADVLVGAPLSSPNGMHSGRAYVVYGKSTSTGVALANVNVGVGGAVLAGPVGNARVGTSVANLGDFDGGGRDDFAIGAEGTGGSTSAVYVVFGESLQSVTELGELGAAAGFELSGAAPGVRLGIRVAGGGDFNGDGIPDLLAGAYSTQELPGRVYVAFGGGPPPTLESIERVRGVGGLVLECEQASDYCGADVAFGGDINDDGFDDLLVGAWRASSSAEYQGRVYVVFGRASTAKISLAAIASGEEGFAIDGHEATDYIGRSVAGGADLDQDGVPDILIGAPGAGDYAGEAHVVSGRYAQRCPAP